MITAIVLVETDVGRIPEVAEEIAGSDGVSEVYSVTGDVDLVAMVRVREHEALADVIADRLNKVEGVRSPGPTSPSAPTPGTTWRPPSRSASTATEATTRRRRSSTGLGPTATGLGRGGLDPARQNVRRRAGVHRALRDPQGGRQALQQGRRARPASRPGGTVGRHDRRRRVEQHRIPDRPAACRRAGRGPPRRCAPRRRRAGRPMRAGGRPRSVGSSGLLGHPAAGHDPDPGRCWSWTARPARPRRGRPAPRPRARPAHRQRSVPSARRRRRPPPHPAGPGWSAARGS